MGREEGEQLKEIVGLFGDPSEVLARTVGEGVRKMMKEREGWKKGNETLGCVVCLHVSNHCIALLLLVHTNHSIKRVREGEPRWYRLAWRKYEGRWSVESYHLDKVVGINKVTQFICGVWGVHICGGLNICLGQEDREGADQILGRISVQDRRTGEGTDLMREVIIHVPIS